MSWLMEHFNIEIQRKGLKKWNRNHPKKWQSVFQVTLTQKWWWNEVDFSQLDPLPLKTKARCCLGSGPGWTGSDTLVKRKMFTCQHDDLKDFNIASRDLWLVNTSSVLDGLKRNPTLTWASLVSSDTESFIRQTTVNRPSVKQEVTWTWTRYAVVYGRCFNTSAQTTRDWLSIYDPRVDFWKTYKLYI